MNRTNPCSSGAGTSHIGACRAFVTEGKYIAEWMRAQIEVKEESITESYLYRLAQAVPTVRYLSFSRWEEARRTGADWEWWFIMPTRALRLRVQAKKLRTRARIRADIGRRNKHGGQLAMLLACARRDNAIPIYTFYSSDTVTRTACGLGSVGIGAFIASARAVHTLLKAPGRIDELRIINICRAAACLPCCVLQSGKASGSIDVAGWLDSQNATRGDALSEADEGWHDVIPDYVSRLIGMGPERAHSQGKWESEAPDDVGAIVTVDMRKGAAEESRRS
jgi:hypothetical protein